MSYTYSSPVVHLDSYLLILTTHSIGAVSREIRHESQMQQLVKAPCAFPEVLWNAALRARGGGRGEGSAPYLSSWQIIHLHAYRSDPLALS